MNPRQQNHNVIGILLAAGKSSRFVDEQGVQRDKLAAGLPGTSPPLTVIESSARALLAVCPRSIAVLRTDSPHQALMQSLGLKPLIAARAELGMGESLAAAARDVMHLMMRHDAVETQHEIKGVIIMLADLPFVKTATINSIVTALSEGASIAVPRYEGKQGHPVGFAVEHLPALAALSSDVGAKQIIKSQAEKIAYIDCVDTGILHDVDTVERLALLAN